MLNLVLSDKSGNRSLMFSLLMPLLKIIINSFTKHTFLKACFFCDAIKMCFVLPTVILNVLLISMEQHNNAEVKKNKANADKNTCL